MQITLSNERLIEELRKWNPNTPIHTACRSGGGFSYTPVEKVDLAYPDKEMSATNPPIIHSSYAQPGLTVEQLITELEQWPGDFPSFIDTSEPQEHRGADYVPVQNVDVYDSSLPVSEENQLGVEAGDSGWLGGEDWTTYPFPGEYLGS